MNVQKKEIIRIAYQLPAGFGSPLAAMQGSDRAIQFPEDRVYQNQKEQRRVQSEVGSRSHHTESKVRYAITAQAFDRFTGAPLAQPRVEEGGTMTDITRSIIAAIYYAFKAAYPEATHVHVQPHGVGSGYCVSVWNAEEHYTFTSIDGGLRFSCSAPHGAQADIFVAQPRTLVAAKAARQLTAEEDDKLAGEGWGKTGAGECICESRTELAWNSGDCPVHYPSLSDPRD